MARESIKAKANLIAAIAENMNDNDWASNIISEAEMIIRAARELIKIVEPRLSGER